MAYVSRNEAGEISAAFVAKQYDEQEFMRDDDPQLLAFYAHLEDLRTFPWEISDRQFFQAAAMRGLISKEEALAAVQHGTIPEILAKFLAEITDPTEHFAATMLLAGATTFRRDHPLVDRFGHEAGLTDPELDDLWRMAAAL